MLPNDTSFDVRLIQDVHMVENNGSFDADWLLIWLSTWQSFIKPHATIISSLLFFIFAITIMLEIRTVKCQQNGSDNRQCKKPRLVEKIGLVVAVAPTLFLFVEDAVVSAMCLVEIRKTQSAMATILRNSGIRGISLVTMIVIPFAMITSLICLDLGMCIVVDSLLSRILAYAIRHRAYAGSCNFIQRNTLAFAALLCGNVCFHIWSSERSSWSGSLLYLFFYNWAALLSVQSFGCFNGWGTIPWRLFAGTAPLLPDSDKHSKGMG